MIPRKRRRWPSQPPRLKAALPVSSTWLTPCPQRIAREQAFALLDRALLKTKATKRLFDRVHIMCEVANR